MLFNLTKTTDKEFKPVKPRLKLNSWDIMHVQSGWFGFMAYQQL